MSLIVAVTGASGAIYAKRFLEVLVEKRILVNLLISDAGRIVLQEELGLTVDGLLAGLGHPECVGLESVKNIASPLASGSCPTDGMAVVPCSMGTLGNIASGTSANLIHRAADVCLKEKRPLVLVPRETPLNAIHLENMLKLSRAGAVILPAMPGFYHRPKSLEEAVDFIVGKILDILKIEHALFERWKEKSWNPLK